jgi:hypothetical protein
MLKQKIEHDDARLARNRRRWSESAVIPDFLVIARSQRVRPSAGPMINSATKQSILSFCSGMDCFAALAMTGKHLSPEPAKVE